MCETCKSLSNRVQGMAARVRRTKPDEYGDALRRRAYQNLLVHVFRHRNETGHDDVVGVAADVIIAFGLRSNR